MSRRFLTLLTLLMFQAPAVALQAFPATKEELAMMPPYCSSPNKSLGKACHALNHYCAALKALIRVDKYQFQNPVESRYWLERAVAAFGSVLDGNWDNKCPLKPEAQVKLGRALLRQGGIAGASAGKALENFTGAMAIQPKYVPAYYALSDYYIQVGDHKKALSVVKEGLKYVPNSKGLLRRFKKLGGTTPPTPVVTSSKADESSVKKDASADKKDAAIESTTNQPASGEESSLQQAPADQSPKPKIGSPTNPWCRFCPPE
ncbi:MAG: hypothetical protein P8164_09015 [Gammaproteobacteria bacterium]|jgi:tetratricopeptide (TPR) repeat protein